MLRLWARTLGLALAGYFQPVTEGAIKVGPVACELEPDGEVFALHAAHQGNQVRVEPGQFVSPERR